MFKKVKLSAKKKPKNYIPIVRICKNDMILYKISKFILFLFVFQSICINTVISHDIENDSLKSFRLGEISVGDSQISNKIKSVNNYNVNYKILNNIDITSANQLRFVLPSSNIRTNSRGESTMLIRGASERQLALYFDGMPLNLAWDGRFDLSIIPSDIIGNVNINSSSNSALFGGNVLGGAIEINTLERFSNGWGSKTRTQINQVGESFISQKLDYKNDNFNSVFNISYLNNPGIIIPKSSDSLGYQNTNDEIRTNTNQSRINTFIRGEYKFDEFTKASLSLNFTKDVLGVQPESFQPTRNVRLWEYPDRNRIFTILNLEHNIDQNNEYNIKTTFWFDKFDQEINVFKDISFNKDSLSGNQIDKNNTIGARILSNNKLTEKSELNLSFNLLSSTHNEIFKDFNNLLDSNSNFDLDFSVLNYSFGGEFINNSINNLVFKLGASYDIQTTPLTGNFKELENNSLADFGTFLSLVYSIDNNFDLFLSSSRRTRFPSLREALSGALNSFVANPDLKQETGIINEIGINYTEQKVNLKFTGFYNLFSDMIVQIRLSKDEDALRRRKRVNLQNANILGFELVGNYEYEQWQFNFNTTFIKTFVETQTSNKYTDNIFSDTSGTKITLENRPELLAGGFIRYNINNDFSAQYEFNYIGNSYQNDGSNKVNPFIKIDGNVIFNLRLNYNLNINNNYNLNFFLRSNNLFDTFRESQLGIIEAGRSFVFGIVLDI